MVRGKPPQFKYNEEKILAEVRDYILSTYTGTNAHYVGKDGMQTLDLIFAAGHGKTYCICNVLKYFWRLGKKDGFNRKDILKAVHYTLLLLYLDDNDAGDRELK